MQKALLLLKKIPRGKVTTYGVLAKLCKTSPRAIGRIVAGNPDPVNYPCYRVVAATGELCGYSGKGGLNAKRRLLEKDGITLVNSRVDKKYFYKFE